MGKPKFITAELLYERDACQAQIDLFMEIFPGWITEVTPEAVLKAARADLDLVWAASEFLSPVMFNRYKYSSIDFVRKYTEDLQTARVLVREGKITRGTFDRRARKLERRLQEDTAKLFMKAWLGRLRAKRKPHRAHAGSSGGVRRGEPRK